MFDFMTHFYDVIYYVKTLGSSSKCSKKKMKCVWISKSTINFCFQTRNRDILKIIFLKKRNKQEL